MAILGTASFDVFDIDVDTLTFDGLAVRVRGKKGPLSVHGERLDLRGAMTSLGVRS